MTAEGTVGAPTCFGRTCVQQRTVHLALVSLFCRRRPSLFSLSNTPITVPITPLVSLGTCSNRLDWTGWKRSSLVEPIFVQFVQKKTSSCPYCAFFRPLSAHECDDFHVTLVSHCVTVQYVILGNSPPDIVYHAFILKKICLV
jgi:hypothetical protein